MASLALASTPNQIQPVRVRNRRAIEIAEAEHLVYEHLEYHEIRAKHSTMTAIKRQELAQRLVASVLALVRTQL
jgi:hypothetical protein